MILTPVDQGYFSIRRDFRAVPYCWSTLNDDKCNKIINAFKAVSLQDT